MNDHSPINLNKKTEVILITLVMLVGFFLRVWRLGDLPNGLDGDVTVAAANSQHIINGMPFQYLQNNLIIGKPVAYLFWSAPLGALILAASIYIFHEIQFSVEFSTVFVGMISLVVFYLLAKKLTNSTNALLSTTLFAISPWHLIFSRSGFVHIALTVFFVCTSLYLTILSLEKGKLSWFVILGLLWGFMLFNIYPVSFFAFPMTLAYLFIARKFGRKSILSLACSFIIGVTTFLFLSILFARLNGAEDPLVVLKDGYFQSVVVRLSETQQNTTRLKNITSGLTMLFVAVPETYQFGVLRILSRPLVDPVVSLTLFLGLIVVLRRRNNTDILLLSWLFLAFISSSVITIPQERYFLVVMPAIFILSGTGLMLLYKAIIVKRVAQYRNLIIVIVTSLFLLYTYNYSYRPYFLEYSMKNSNLTNGLAERDLAAFVNKTFNPNTSMIVKSADLSAFNLFTDNRYQNQIMWKDLIKKIINDDENLALSSQVFEKHPYGQNIVENIKDGNIDTFWLGKVPVEFEMSWNNPKEIGEIVIFFDSLGGRENISYQISFVDSKGKLTLLKKKEDNLPSFGENLSSLEVTTKKLKFSFINTNISDSVQKVEEIIIYPAERIKRTSPLGLGKVEELVFIASINPNFNYYGNYNIFAGLMNRQVQTLFPNYRQNLRKTITGEQGRPIFKVFNLNNSDQSIGI